MYNKKRTLRNETQYEVSVIRNLFSKLKNVNKKRVKFYSKNGRRKKMKCSVSRFNIVRCIFLRSTVVIENILVNIIKNISIKTKK